MSKPKTVVITSSTSLNESQQEIIKKHLAQSITSASDNLHFRFITNPDLIGGLVFQFDDVLIDTSVAEKLSQLKLFLKRKLSL